MAEDNGRPAPLRQPGSDLRDDEGQPDGSRHSAEEPRLLPCCRLRLRLGRPVRKVFVRRQREAPLQCQQRVGQLVGAELLSGADDPLGQIALRVDEALKGDASPPARQRLELPRGASEQGSSPINICKYLNLQSIISNCNFKICKNC